MRLRLPTVSFVTVSYVIALSLIGLTTAVPSVRAMSFQAAQTSGGGAAIYASGQITESTPQEFLSFMQETYGGGYVRPIVYLNSPGGRVLASMQFGTLLRRVGASTIVDGQCFSACVYALMGGRQRIIRGQVGIHRMFAYEAEVDSSGEAYVRRRYDNGAMGSILKSYTSRMGVSPALISAAEHTPSDGLKILSRGEIRRYRLGSN